MLFYILPWTFLISTCTIRATLLVLILYKKTFIIKLNYHSGYKLLVVIHCQRRAWNCWQKTNISYALFLPFFIPRKEAFKCLVHELPLWESHHARRSTSLRLIAVVTGVLSQLIHFSVSTNNFTLIPKHLSTICFSFFSTSSSIFLIRLN